VPATTHGWSRSYRCVGVPVARRYVEGINEWIGAQLRNQPER
jgi:hypothetical protein